ncbi:hypothetical protein BH24ACT26_BH24ACT26_07980 [soil metagenome]
MTDNVSSGAHGPSRQGPTSRRGDRMAGGPEQGRKEVLDEASRDLHRTISHNLRTPLAVIKGCTDMLLAHGGEELDEARRQELLLTTSTNVEILAEAIVWLEERIDVLAERGVIRLPREGEHSSGGGSSSPSPGQRV